MLNGFMIVNLGQIANIYFEQITDICWADNRHLSWADSGVRRN